MEKHFLDDQENLRKTIDTIPVGIWHWYMDTGEEWWSKRYYQLLGYEEGEIKASQKVFEEQIIHPEDKQRVASSFFKEMEEGESFRTRLRLKMKSGEYRWFLTTGQKIEDSSIGNLVVGSLVDIQDEVELQEDLERSELILKETGKIAKVGGWEVDLQEQRAIWSDEVYYIHELEPGTEVSIDEAINYYHPDDRDRVREDFRGAVEDKKPYDNIYKFITAKGNERYVHGIGIPIENENGEVITVRGIFQDIDERKRAELLMEETLAIATEQNQKLINFAHIVSHNLRNHTSNLEMLVDFALNTTEKSDRDELLEKIGQVSENLSETIVHLNEIVKVQHTATRHVDRIDVTQNVMKILDILTGDFRKSQATCEVDLPEGLSVYFAPAYLDSVLLNLFSNAIRYRSPKRKLRLNIWHEENEEYVVLYVKDNGLGIDLKKYKNRIFTLYSTFHSHPESKGVGLYISKNQIESLGGKMTVESEPDVGTTFAIHLCKN